MSGSQKLSLPVRVLGVAILLVGLGVAAEPWLLDTGREAYRATKGLLLAGLGVGVLVFPSFFSRSDDEDAHPGAAPDPAGR
jgi:hypothetical protein